MDNSDNTSLQRFAQHKWSIIALVFICVLFFGTWYFLANYAILTLSVTIPSSVNKSDVSVEANYGASSQKIKLNGTSIIPRKTATLTIATNNQQLSTTTSLSIPWYGVTSKQTTLRADYNADKVAYRSTLGSACATYSPASDQLLAYQCSNYSALVHYNTSTSQWGVASIADIPITGAVTPYRGGVIGITMPSDSNGSAAKPLIYVAPDGTYHYYDLPDGVDYSSVYQTTIVTNPTDTSDGRFMIVANSGTVYLATVTDNGRVNYITVSPASGYNPSTTQTLCAFRKTYAYCYQGAHDSDVDTTKKTSVQPKVIQVSFNSSRVQSRNIDTSLLSSFYVTNDGTLFGQQYKSLSLLKQVGDSYKSQEVANNADYAQSSDKLYFISQGGVSTYDSKTNESYQLFRSPNIKPTSILLENTTPFIIGKSVNSDSYTYAWKINSELDTNYGSRLIDLLPSFPVTGAYGATDLVGNTINIDPVTGSAATTEDIRQKKQDTLEYLRLLGVDTNSVKLSNP